MPCMRRCLGASDQEHSSCVGSLPMSVAAGQAGLDRQAAPDVLWTPLQDAVPRVGKFLTLFSRPGKRVIIDYRGDVVVRPSPYEIFIRSGEPAAAAAACRAWPPTAGPAESYLMTLRSCQGTCGNFFSTVTDFLEHWLKRRRTGLI